MKVSRAAIDDLHTIATFTERRWGHKQRNAYIARFKKAFAALSGNPMLGVACEGIRPGYRKLLVGQHVVFYLVPAGSAIEIIRILHQEMDVDAVI